MNIVVKSVLINKETALLADGNSHWYWLDRADLVFVYCSRTATWEWFAIPIITAKKHMRPEAKMIAQWDDDFVWLEHPDWVWWDDDWSIKNNPELLERVKYVLSIPDAYLSVIENPPFIKYSTKPLYYLPLPHLWRYFDVRLYLENQTDKNIFDNRHFICLLNHSSRVSSCRNTINRVIKKVNIPVFLFNRRDIRYNELPIGSKLFKVTGRKQFSTMIRDNCYIAIDDNEGYMGWGRLAMECAQLSVACIGSTKSVKEFFPDLYIEHNDFDKQVELIRRLTSDKKFWTSCIEKAQRLVSEKLNDDILCNRFMEIGESLGIPSTGFNVHLELLKETLYGLLPWCDIPKRPKENQSTFDHAHNMVCDQKQWDEWYAEFEPYMRDEKQYRAIISEVMERKKRAINHS